MVDPLVTILNIRVNNVKIFAFFISSFVITSTSFTIFPSLSITSKCPTFSPLGTGAFNGSTTKL